MIKKGVSIKLDLPEEVIAVFEDASRISKVDFNTVITVVLAMHVASRRSAAVVDGKPKAVKAGRKAKSK